MRRGWQTLGGRERLAISLASLIVAAAFVAFVLAPPDAAAEAGRWRFDAATAALLVAVGVLLRGRPGLSFATLAFASFSLGGSITSAWYAFRSASESGGVPIAADPALALVALSSLAVSTVPIVILGLYASAPERRLGTWVGAAAWAVTIASGVGVFAHLSREVAGASGQTSWVDAGDPFYQLDGPLPVLLISALGMLGSLRLAARRWVPPRVSASEGRPPGVVRAPSRLLLAAVAAATLLWIPATIAYLNRPMSLDPGEDNTRLIFVPILAALVGIVAERWSRLVSWSAVAVAFESIAFLVLFRGAADYVVYALSFPDPSGLPLTITFVFVLVAAAMIVLFAFAAVSLALRDAWESPGPSASTRARDDDPERDRRWATRGAVVGLGLTLWFVGGAMVGSGVSAVLGAGLLPMYAIPIAIALTAWHRLVRAVAEAESVAVTPLGPLRYLETVALEAVTGRAEHRRRAAHAERERLATQLQTGVLPDLQRLASTTAAGAPREEVAERLRDVQEALRRLLGDGSRTVLEPAYSGGGARPAAPRGPSTLPRPSRRELEVLGLVAAGASNEEVARELFLSLKTVESHLRRLFGRYGVTNRTELAVLAVREGWVDAP
jgi:DNA-binding CsgD family transcriptional regulator